jgi:MscS family membrane protein
LVELLRGNIAIQLGLLVLVVAVSTFFLGQLGVRILNLGVKYLANPEQQIFFERVVQSRLSLVGNVIALGLLDLIVWMLFKTWLYATWYPTIEFGLSFLFLLVLGWLSSRLFQNYFDSYLLDAAAKQGRKVNSEFLVLAKFFANFAIVILLVILFGQTHHLNIVGLIASLGVGGIAIAFAAQKVLEQLLGGMVIYIDRPFSIDDYIGLPDGTYGRVESIGLRSTKIRTSGKGTLAIVPNNAIIQSTVENFTGAKKVMALLYLDFSRLIPPDEQALIRQVVMESTQDIFGIDSRNTDLVFKADLERQTTQAQITFFILGSEDVSMKIRRQLLDIANQNLAHQLKEYGIAFDIEAPTIYVDSPITI